MPMPVTIWFARSVTLRNACSAATGATATTPMTRPISGLPVAHAPTAAAKAPVSIMPSRLMLSTPARSLTSSPMPASSSGAARRIDEPTKTANSQVIHVHRRAALRVEPERGARQRDDDQALDHHHERGRHAGHHLHVDAARAQEAEQQRGRDHAGDRAAREQAGDEAVEAVARREALLERHTGRPASSGRRRVRRARRRSPARRPRCGRTECRRGARRRD